MATVNFNKKDNSLVGELRSKLDEQFKSEALSTIAVFGKGIYENVIAKEYTMQMSEKLLEAYVNDIGVTTTDGIELIMNILLNSELNEENKANIDTAEFSLFFNFATNTIDYDQSDDKLVDIFNKGIDDETMTPVEMQAVYATNIKNLVLASSNTVVLFYFYTPEMEKLEGQLV